VTPENQQELRRELLALDALLTKLVPEDGLARLALDPKRQAAAAQHIGTITLAREVLGSALSRVLESSPNGTKDQLKPWLLRHISNKPTPKAKIIEKAKAVGHGYAAVYSAMNKLEEEGLVKSKKAGTGNRQEVWKP